MHAVSEGNRFALDTNKSALENEVNNSASYWNDSERFGEAMGKIGALVESGARLRGETDPESIKAATTQWQSRAWMARIQSMSAQNPHLARELFDQNAENIDATHRAQIDARLTQQQQTFDRAREVEELKRERDIEKQLKKQQEEAQKVIVTKLFDKTLTPAEILNAPIPATMQEHYLGALKRRLKESDEESKAKTNQRITQQLYAGIVNGTVTDASQILSYVKENGGLDINHAPALVNMLEQAQKPGGLKYGHMVVNAARDATKTLNGDQLIFNKSVIPGAVNNFMFELGERIKKAESEGKNPRFLVDPTKPENMLRPEVLRQFIPGKATSLREAAEAVNPQTVKGKIGGPAFIAPVVNYPIAVNPQTGEKLILKDGKWQKP